MRAFIAIDFNDDLKRDIASLQSGLRGFCTEGRWKHKDNFHLTLKFLGEIDNTLQTKIAGELERLCKTKERFKLRIAELGAFQGRGNIRVLWLGLGGDLEKLYDIQKTIDLKLEALGFEREKRPFTPHVTIGQDICFNQQFEEIQKIADIKRFSVIEVNSILLFKSEQIGNRRVYTPINELNLK